MANVTRIKAKDPHAKSETPKPKQAKKSKKTTATKTAEEKLEQAQAAEVVETKTAKSAKAAKAAKAKKAEKTEVEKPKKTKKAHKLPKILWVICCPFIKLGSYIKASWRELRQVRWPNRKYTWKMTLAVLVYCALFIVIISLLDLLFSLIFNNLLG